MSPAFYVLVPGNFGKPSVHFDSVDARHYAKTGLRENAVAVVPACGTLDWKMNKMSVDVNFFKPFVDGTLLTLKIQCSLEAKVGKPFYKQKSSAKTFDITGIIGLTSNAFNGSIAICFPKAVFLTLMSNMLGEQYGEITPDLEDGAAELLNIIFGHAKRVLNGQNYSVQKAIPTIVRGDNIETRHLTSSPIVVLPFNTEKGEFHIEIALEPDPLTGRAKK